MPHTSSEANEPPKNIFAKKLVNLKDKKIAPPQPKEERKLESKLRKSDELRRQHSS